MDNHKESINSSWNDDVLLHFGIPGMKWGKRKARSTVSEDHKESRKLIRKKTSELSSKELKDLTQRLQLEKQLKDLHPSDYKKGMQFVKEITAAGTTLSALYAMSKTPLIEDVKKAMNAAMKASKEAEKAKWVI